MRVRARTFPFAAQTTSVIIEATRCGYEVSYDRPMNPSRILDDVRSLLEAPAAAVLVTYRRDGSADVSPVWFRFMGEAFEVVVAKGDVKLSHLTNDPRAMLMVFEAGAPFRGVKVRTDVELEEGRVDEVRRDIATRYLGVEAGQAFAAGRSDGAVVRLPASAAHVWDLAAILPGPA